MTYEVTYSLALRTADDAGNPAVLSNMPLGTIPDRTLPAAIRNLAVGFVRMSWDISLALPAVGGEGRRL